MKAHHLKTKLPKPHRELRSHKPGCPEATEESPNQESCTCRTWESDHKVTYDTEPIPAPTPVDKPATQTNPEKVDLEELIKTAFLDGRRYGECDSDCVLNSWKEFEEKARKHTKRPAELYSVNNYTNEGMIRIERSWYEGYEFGIGFDSKINSNRSINSKSECPKCGNITWNP